MPIDESSLDDELFDRLADAIAKEGVPVLPAHLEGLSQEQIETLSERLADAGAALLLQAGRMLEMPRAKR
jgi:hypothetical protein